MPAASASVHRESGQPQSTPPASNPYNSPPADPGSSNGEPKRHGRTQDLTHAMGPMAQPPPSHRDPLFSLFRCLACGFESTSPSIPSSTIRLGPMPGSTSCTHTIYGTTGSTPETPPVTNPTTIQPPTSFEAQATPCSSRHSSLDPHRIR